MARQTFRAAIPSVTSRFAGSGSRLPAWIAFGRMLRMHPPQGSWKFGEKMPTRFEEFTEGHGIPHDLDGDGDEDLFTREEGEGHGFVSHGNPGNRRVQ